MYEQQLRSDPRAAQMPAQMPAPSRPPMPVSAEAPPPPLRISLGSMDSALNMLAGEIEQLGLKIEPLYSRSASTADQANMVQGIQGARESVGSSEVVCLVDEQASRVRALTEIVRLCRARLEV